MIACRSFLHLNSYNLVGSVTFIFAIILFLVYHSYILGLVRLDLYTCLGSYSIYPLDPWVNDRYCVGMVLIPYLSAIVPYMPDRGVVRGSDSSIDSYIVPLSCIGLAECWVFLTSLPKVDLVFKF